MPRSLRSQPRFRSTAAYSYNVSDPGQRHTVISRDEHESRVAVREVSDNPRSPGLLVLSFRQCSHGNVVYVSVSRIPSSTVLAATGSFMAFSPMLRTTAIHSGSRQTRCASGRSRRGRRAGIDRRVFAVFRARFLEIRRAGHGPPFPLHGPSEVRRLRLRHQC
jgi:hypothetical protein